MIAPDRLALFVVAALALLLVPGPAVLYVVTRSIHQGKRAGLVSVLGIHLGTLVHITAATAGLVGLARLVGVGVHGREARRRRVPDRSRPLDAPFEDARGRDRTRRERRASAGVRTGYRRQRAEPEDGALLPRLPAAVRRSGPRPRHAADRLAGATFALLGMVTDSIWAVGAGAAGDVLRRSRRFAHVSGTCPARCSSAWA